MSFRCKNQLCRLVHPEEGKPVPSLDARQKEIDERDDWDRVVRQHLGLRVVAWANAEKRDKVTAGTQLNEALTMAEGKFRVVVQDTRYPKRTFYLATAPKMAGGEAHYIYRTADNGEIKRISAEFVELTKA